MNIKKPLFTVISVFQHFLYSNQKINLSFLPLNDILRRKRSLYLFMRLQYEKYTKRKKNMTPE